MLGVLVLAASIGALSPDEIFARAGDVWAHQAAPAYMEYDVAIDVVEGGREQSEHYEAACDCGSGELRVQKMSREEIAHPYQSHGVNVYFTWTLGMGGGGSETSGARLSAPPQPVDVMGVPLLNPLYAFGIGTALQHPVSHAVTSLPIIASTSTTLQRYIISRSDDVVLDGRPAYHLILSPLERPQEYRLRDLWIERSSFDTLQARVASNFSGAWYSNVPWTIRFSTEGGFEHIVSEASDGPTTVGRMHYNSVSVAFEHVREPEERSKRFWLPQTPVDNALMEP